MESMDDYKEELEASLKKIRVGDVVTGTVLDVTDDAVIVDLKTYADGVIRKEDLSEDPDFNMAEMIHPGDEITATVMATNDGEGNMVLSKKEANQVLAWDKLKTMMEERMPPVRYSSYPLKTPQPVPLWEAAETLTCPPLITRSPPPFLMPQQSPLSEAALMSRVPLVMVIQSSQAIPLQELSPLTEMSRAPSPPIVRLPRA